MPLSLMITERGLLFSEPLQSRVRHTAFCPEIERQCILTGFRLQHILFKNDVLFLRFFLQVVSTLRSELDKMLKDFNIYVDTPCCILTQEESKRLIHGSAKEKYEFFIKATGLKLLFEEFVAGEKDVADCTTNIERARPQLQQLKVDFAAARDKAKEFEALDHIDEKIRFTSAQLFWDQVRSEEAVVVGLNEKLDRIKGRVQTAQNDVDNAAELDGAQKDAQIKHLTTAVDGVSRELAEVVEQKRRKEQEASQLTKQIGRSRVQLDSVEQSRNDHKKRLKEVTADVSEP